MGPKHRNGPKRRAMNKLPRPEGRRRAKSVRAARASERMRETSRDRHPPLPAVHGKLESALTLSKSALRQMSIALVKNGYEEDKGFAINGGDGWSSVKFDNHDIACYGEVAIAMGTYYFTSAKDESVAKVEYTFGYKRCGDGKVRICLHHSSVPYKA